jgi:hypothetical protein
MLDWVADEFLVKPEMFDKVFRPLGIASRPVLDSKSIAVLQTVVQPDPSSNPTSGSGRFTPSFT